MSRVLTYSIHPFLLAISFALFLYTHNIDQISYDVAYDVILLPILFLLFLTLAVFLISRFIVRDHLKAGIISSIIMVFLLYYGVVYEIIKGWQLFDVVIGRQRVLMPVWIILAFSGIYLTVKTKKQLSALTAILNIFTIIFILTSIVNMAVYEFRPSDFKPEYIAPEFKDKEGHALPDIYYIIPDAYAGADILRKYFNYNNDEFLSYLENKGFAIAEKSRSNYGTTILSFGSTLNGRYLDDLIGYQDPDETDWKWAKEAMDKNTATLFLREKGYQIIQFRLGPIPLIDVDMEFGRTYYNEYGRLLINSTILRAVRDRQNFISYYLVLKMRENFVQTFEELDEIPTLDVGKPKFVYFHIPSPHFPYLFGQNGENVGAKFINNEPIDPKKEKELYLGQLIFLNGYLKQAIDSILSKSSRPPIIIIQSDHGFHSPYEKGFDDSAAKVKNFSAYYLPGKPKSVLPQDMSPVNTFRFIFDQYFGTTLGLLENKSFGFDGEHPYLYLDIPSSSIRF